MGAETDVAIIGAGPAGLAAALALKARGIGRIVVLEREAEAGGIPRHCGHRTFGLVEFGWPMTGPSYARRLAAQALKAGIVIRTRSTVTALRPGGALAVNDPASGPSTLAARRVLIATGVRETPRAARLIGGARPVGVLTTGALQNFVYLQGTRPFTRPVIIGTELVSFSSLLTCRHLGITPLMMIEQNTGPTARSFFTLYPKLTGIPIRYETKLTAVEGKDRVTAVRLEDNAGTSHTVACDGVLFTGQFVPASELILASHLSLDSATGGPVIDQYGRLSDPVYYAAGNVLHPVETSGWCHREGRDVGEIIADDLAGRLPAPTGEATITAGAGIKYIVPQRLSSVPSDHAFGVLQLRVPRPVSGRLVLSSRGERLWSRPVSLKPERRILLPLAPIAGYLDRPDLTLGIAEDR